MQEHRYTKEELDLINAEKGVIGYAIDANTIQVGGPIHIDSRVTGPIYGGELQLDMFGVCVHSGDSAIARFYNGRMTETKRLVEVINGKIYIRDERFG